MSRKSPTGDVATFVRGVIEEFQHPLYSYLAALLGDGDLAREKLIELFQEALTSARYGRVPFTERHGRKRMRYELFRMATSLIEAHWRRQRIVRWNDPPIPPRDNKTVSDVPPPVDRVQANATLVARAIAALPDRARMYLVLHVVFGFQPAIIARHIMPDAGETGPHEAIARNTSSAVRMWVTRAKIELRAVVMDVMPADKEQESQKGQMS